VIAIGDAYRATLLMKLRLHLRQLVRQLIGAIGGDLDVLEDNAALVLELFTNHKIEIVVRASEFPGVTTQSSAQVSNRSLQHMSDDITESIITE